MADDDTGDCHSEGGACVTSIEYAWAARRAMRPDECTARQAASILGISHWRFRQFAEKDDTLLSRVMPGNIRLYRRGAIDALRASVKPTRAQSYKLDSGDIDILKSILFQYIRANADIAPEVSLRWAKTMIKRLT